MESTYQSSSQESCVRKWKAFLDLFDSDFDRSDAESDVILQKELIVLRKKISVVKRDNFDADSSIDFDMNDTHLMKLGPAARKARFLTTK